MNSVLVPCGNRLLVRQFEADEKSKGGILIPDEAKRKPGKGKVLAAGEEVEEILDGDVIFFNTYDATLLEIEGMELTVLDADKVLLRVTDKKKEEKE